MLSKQKSRTLPSDGIGDVVRKPRVAILYHYMYPDDVVSALHLDGLAADLAALGWEVEALPCVRGCRDETLRYSASEVHNGVQYNRIWRPRFRQSSFAGRLANSLWMTMAWTRLALRSRARRPDVVVIGTDPVFAVATAIPIKLLSPRTRVVHWCFDLFPEFAIASGRISASALATRLVRQLMRASYKRCDVIIDIGPCMRTLLREYDHSAVEFELTPWALLEPKLRVEADADTRKELFGHAKLGILYSGNFGEAHSYHEILAVARSLRDAPDIHFCFAVRGNMVDELKAAITPHDSNISFAGFAPIEELEKRLGAADIHVATLRPEGTGIAVPSKFFGSIALGRPVLYSGTQDSAIAQWINEFDIGLVLNMENVDQIAGQLRDLVHAPEALLEMQNRAHSVYQAKFSKQSVTSEWNTVLKSLLEDTAEAA